MQAKMLMAAAQKRPSDGVNTGQKLCLEHGSNIQTLHTGHSVEQRFVSSHSVGFHRFNSVLWQGKKYEVLLKTVLYTA